MVSRPEIIILFTIFIIVIGYHINGREFNTMKTKLPPLGYSLSVYKQLRFVYPDMSALTAYQISKY